MDEDVENIEINDDEVILNITRLQSNSNISNSMQDIHPDHGVQFKGGDSKSEYQL